MNPTTVLVDGAASESISVLDRGFALGDGVFRTMAVRGARALNWKWHWRRLQADCGLLRLPVPDEATLVRETAQVAPGDAVVKLFVTRGQGTRGYAIAPGAATRVVAAFPMPSYPAAWAAEGVRVRKCALVLSEQPRLAGAKTLNRLENVLARSEWDDAAVAEGLLVDAGGRVIEGTMSNVFVVHADRIATPDLARCGVVGAQRERVRELVQADGGRCEVRDVSWDELMGADEVFLTNSLIGLWPVAACEDRRWAPGPWARRLQDAIARQDAGA